MEFERLTAADQPGFERAYELYQASFPDYERRPLEDQQAILCRPEYHFQVIREGGMFAGILLYWEAEDFVFVEHLAVNPELRGRKLGSQVLNRLLAEGKPVILEIDPPVDEISLRRQRFYHRLGFHTNPWPHVQLPYHPRHTEHALVVMSSPSPLDEGQYGQFWDYLKRTVMPRPPERGTGQETG